MSRLQEEEMKTTIRTHAELDALVAERVEHYDSTENPDNHTDHDRTLFWHDEKTGRCLVGRAYKIRSLDNTWSHTWYKYNPSTDIAAAWQVIERLKEREKWPSLIPCEIGWNCSYVSGFKPNGDTVESDHLGDTAPLAICLCALASVGIDVTLELTI